jgi:hypothetical protein
MGRIGKDGCGGKKMIPVFLIGGWQRFPIYSRN